jgi:hypothetical protein
MPAWAGPAPGGRTGGRRPGGLAVLGRAAGARLEGRQDGADRERRGRSEPAPVSVDPNGDPAHRLLVTDAAGLSAGATFTWSATCV